MHILRRWISTYPHSSGIKHEIGHENFVITSENYLGMSPKPEMRIPVLCAVILSWKNKLVLAISSSGLTCYPHLFHNHLEMKIQMI